MFLNTFSPTRSPNPEAGSWVVAPHQGRPFGTAQKRSWSYTPGVLSSVLIMFARRPLSSRRQWCSWCAEPPTR